MYEVADASLANSFPTSNPEERAAYRGIYQDITRRLMRNCRWRLGGWN
jgi:hypothetical protein